MYRISKKIRKHSPTAIVQVITDDNGKETEKFITAVRLPKKEGDILSKQIVDNLNKS